METLTLAAFCLVILFSVLFDFSLPYALLIGLFIFCAFALKKGFTPKELAKMIIEGVLTARNVIIVFSLIGMLTALWRASGTIAVIICYAVQAVHPSIVVLMAFLLNCLVSFLTGTSFGTAATMGVIAMTLGRAMGADSMFLGGAILAGAFFGDRCSPVSTSAMIVCELTHTNIFDNIKLMFKQAWIPFFVSCGLYLLTSFFTTSSGSASLDLAAIFSKELNLSWLALLPAILILTLSLLRVQVKMAMLASILLAAIIGHYQQQLSLQDIFNICVYGFTAKTPEVGRLLNGGGITSMLRVTAIIAISSSYAGIFKATGLLEGLQTFLKKLSERLTPFGSIIVSSLFTTAISCNQTLATMLTYQLCHDLEPDNTTFALSLENSVITLSALVPWAIACAVPLSAVNAPTSSIFFAFFLYLLPAYTFIQKKRKLSQ